MRDNDFFDRLAAPKKVSKDALITFEVTGKLGVLFNSNTGLVTKVSEGQAKSLGVEKGWNFHRIDDLPFSTALLKQKCDGEAAYQITFKTPSAKHQPT